MMEEFTDPQRPHHGEHHVRTPTDELSQRRQRLHVNVLSGVVILVLLMLAYAAAFDLDSAAE